MYIETTLRPENRVFKMSVAATSGGMESSRSMGQVNPATTSVAAETLPTAAVGVLLVGVLPRGAAVATLFRLAGLPGLSVDGTSTRVISRFAALVETIESAVSMPPSLELPMLTPDLELVTCRRLLIAPVNTNLESTTS
jgi:hypothetical protein